MPLPAAALSSREIALDEPLRDCTSLPRPAVLLPRASWCVETYPGTAAQVYFRTRGR